MQSRRRRKEIRKLARDARGRSGAPPPFEELSCPCGHRFRLATGDENKTFMCPACANRYKATRLAADSALTLFKIDPSPPAEDEPSLFPSRIAGESSAYDTNAPTAVHEALRDDAGEKGVLDSSIEPAPPAQLDFDCPCGQTLTATRQTYDRRARCSACGQRLLVSLVYNPDEQRFTIIPLRVSDPSSGDTDPIPRK